MQSEMYNSVNTFEFLSRRLASKIEAKNTALMLVGLPKIILLFYGASVIGFFSFFYGYCVCYC